MPNVKTYVDTVTFAASRARLAATLGPIRDMLWRELGVDVAACQFAVLAVMAMPDLPQVNRKMAIMPRPDRTRAALLEVCAKLRAVVGAATGTHVAMRVFTLDPETCIALKYDPPQWTRHRPIWPLRSQAFAMP